MSSVYPFDHWTSHNLGADLILNSMNVFLNTVGHFTIFYQSSPLLISGKYKMTSLHFVMFLYLFFYFVSLLPSCIRMSRLFPQCTGNVLWSV